MADDAQATRVRADGDQWITALRREVLDGDPVCTAVAARMAAIITDQHPGMPGLGRVVADAALAALACREWLERKNAGRPLTADALANLIGIAGIALIDQEEARNG